MRAIVPYNHCIDIYQYANQMASKRVILLHTEFPIVSLTLDLTQTVETSSTSASKRGLREQYGGNCPNWEPEQRTIPLFNMDTTWMATRIDKGAGKMITETYSYRDFCKQRRVGHGRTVTQRNCD